MRVKTIQLDNVLWEISPLTVEQYEDMLDGSDNQDATAARERMWNTVLNGLNNALSDEEDAKRYTKAKLRKAIDLPSFLELHRAILEYSGLKIDSKPGETQAT